MTRNAHHMLINVVVHWSIVNSLDKKCSLKLRRFADGLRKELGVFYGQLRLETCQLWPQAKLLAGVITVITFDYWPKISL